MFRTWLVPAALQRFDRGRERGVEARAQHIHEAIALAGLDKLQPLRLRECDCIVQAVQTVLGLRCSARADGGRRQFGFPYFLCLSQSAPAPAGLITHRLRRAFPIICSQCILIGRRLDGS